MRKKNSLHLMMIFLTLLALMIVSICTSKLSRNKNEFRCISIIEVYETSPNLSHIVFIQQNSIAPDTVINETLIPPSAGTTATAIIRDGKLKWWKKIPK